MMDIFRPATTGRTSFNVEQYLVGHHPCICECGLGFVSVLHFVGGFAHHKNSSRHGSTCLVTRPALLARRTHFGIHRHPHGVSYSRQLHQLQRCKRSSAIYIVVQTTSSCSRSDRILVPCRHPSHVTHDEKTQPIYVASNSHDVVPVVSHHRRPCADSRKRCGDAVVHRLFHGTGHDGNRRWWN